MKKIIFAVLFLLFAVWFLYDQTADFEFLRLDDHDYTFRCAFVKDGLSVANVTEAFTNFRHAAVWMPATYLSYMADISLFGPGMGPHHLVSVAFHSLNAVLLFILLLALAKRLPSSGNPPVGHSAPLSLPLFLPLLAALFWALHPQRAEAVAWIAGRKDVICGTFTLLGLLAWLSPTLLGRLGAFLCGALACMSKPTAMCYPFLLLSLDLLLARGPFKWKMESGKWKMENAPSEMGTDPFKWRIENGKWKMANGPLMGTDSLEMGTDPLRKKEIIRYLVLFVPFFALSIFTGVLAVYSQTHAEGYVVRDLFSASFPWRVLNALVAVGLSLAQLVVPVGIHLDYRSVPGQFPVQGVLGLVVFALALVGCVWLVRRPTSRRPTVALLVFFLSALVPTLGIFGSFGEHARADRFLYLPMLAVSVAFILGRPSRPRLVLGIGSAIIVLNGILAYPLVASYRNDYTAFSRTLACDPDHGRALAHVASEECARFNHIDKGIELYRRSQQVRPRDDTAAQLSYALMMRARSEDYAEIRRLCSKFACDHSLDRKGQALEALGTTAMRQRRWTEAISCLEDSIKAPLRFYSSEDAFLNLAACYCNANRSADAIAIFERLTQSRRNDIANRALQALTTLKANPKAVIFF